MSPPSPAAMSFTGWNEKTVMSAWRQLPTRDPSSYVAPIA
jgi:hypothetical protein